MVRLFQLDSVLRLWFAALICVAGAWTVRRANRTIWLNPEAPYQWGSGDSDMLAYYPLCDDVLQVSTLSDLGNAIDGLLM